MALGGWEPFSKRLWPSASSASTVIWDQRYPGHCGTLGAAPMSQVDSEALVRALLGLGTHLDGEHSSTLAGGQQVLCFSPSLCSVILLCGEIIKSKDSAWGFET